MSIGGSVESVSWFGREFAATADADGNRDLGGFTNAFEPNGNKTGRITKTRKGWAFEGISLSINDANGDQEFLQEKIDAGQNGPWAVTLASGYVYQGVGQLVGDLKVSTMNTTAPVEFRGPGNLTKQ